MTTDVRMARVQVALPETAPAPPVSARAAWTTVGIFWLCFVVATLDRQVIAITGRSIQADLHLSDTQLGFIQGPAFAFCAALAGVPLGWLLDRGNRVAISSVCLAVWSVTTSATAFVLSFPALAIARAGGAFGEAGLAPAALSIFADVFPPNKIPRASAAFLTAPGVGAGLGLLAGGLLLDYFTHLAGDLPSYLRHFKPWQLVFLAVGFPSLLLAVILRLVVKDPSRIAHAPIQIGPDADADAGRQTGWMLATFVAGMTTLVVVMYVQLAWFPMRVLRSFHTTASETGLIIGPTYVVAGLLGALAAGWIASAARPERVLNRVMNIIITGAAGLVVPFAIAALSTDKWVASGAFFVGVTLLSTALTLASSPIQLLVSRRMRARALALSTVAFNVIGAGAGPVLTGYLSDRLKDHTNAVGIAITMVTCVSIAIGLIALLRVRHVLIRRQAIIALPDDAGAFLA